MWTMLASRRLSSTKGKVKARDSLYSLEVTSWTLIHLFQYKEKKFALNTYTGALAQYTIEKDIKLHPLFSQNWFSTKAQLPPSSPCFSCKWYFYCLGMCPDIRIKHPEIIKNRSCQKAVQDYIENLCHIVIDNKGG